MPPTYDDLSRPPLSEAELSRALTTGGSRWTEVHVVDVLPSTNAVLGQRARDGQEDGLVLIAEHQTAGRGRLDRTWTAPPGAGVTMSVLVRPAGIAVSRWPWISLVSGLAVAAAVQQVAEVDARLKWPNDVVVDDRKLAGVLVERVEGPGPAAAVIGIGLNVTATADELPTTQATSLRIEGASMTDRSTLVKAILRRLDGLLAEWEAGGGEPRAGLRDAYQAACTTLGRRVSVELPGRSPLEGEAVRIDDFGRLVVLTGSGERAFGAGDVTHVRRPA
jgi:BirA family biotin operon repressor/biotin-[acetyl-CoA-carboxylase] ligase